MIHATKMLTFLMLTFVPAQALGQSAQPAPAHVPLQKTIGLSLIHI